MSDVPPDRLSNRFGLRQHPTLLTFCSKRHYPRAIVDIKTDVATRSGPREPGGIPPEQRFSECHYSTSRYLGTTITHCPRSSTFRIRTYLISSCYLQRAILRATRLPRLLSCPLHWSVRYRRPIHLRTAMNATCSTFVILALFGLNPLGVPRRVKFQVLIIICLAGRICVRARRPVGSTSLRRPRSNSTRLSTGFPVLTHLAHSLLLHYLFVDWKGENKSPGK